MKVLITGATGFIGSHLVGVLQKAGHSVVAFSRSAAAAHRRVPGIPRVHQWDPSVGPPPREAFEGVDAVVHLAGESLQGRWTVEKKQAIQETRIAGTRNLVQGMAALKARPRVLVSASAVGYYGDRGEEVLTEESPPGNDFLSGVCTAWEAEAAGASTLGIRVVRLRSGIVLGKTGGAFKALLLPFKLGLGGPLGSGRQWWSWVHIDDETGFILYALTKEIEGACNVTSPSPATQREFAKTLGRVLKRPALLPAPAFALNLVLGEVTSELLHSRRALPKRAEAAGYRFVFPALEPALLGLVTG